jgi:hypothetical protein
MPVAPTSGGSLIWRIYREGEGVRCETNSQPVLIPVFVAGHLRNGDDIRADGATSSPVDELLALRTSGGRRPLQLYLCRIGYVTQPKNDRHGHSFVRAEVPASKLGITSVHLPCSAIRDYFYFFNKPPGADRRPTLYELLQAPAPTAAFADLRLCYRMRRLELSAAGLEAQLRCLERAFNMVMHPETRACYDALLRDPDSPAVFPYGGGGQCLVSGEQDGETFFARQILRYIPDQTQRTFRAPLRRIDFHDGYAVYRDSRRNTEVYIDHSLLPIGWDPTWNQWKHLVGTKIGISAAFVDSGKYRRCKDQWRLVQWQTALPSRLNIAVPADAMDKINAARRSYQRLGEHYDAIAAIRERLEREPVEYRDLADLCRKLRLPSDFDVSLLCWQPDYDRFFFDQLKKRSVKVFLFRSEYIFELGRAAVAEVPRLGNATYVFARPPDILEFVRRYSMTTRDDLRRNRGNVAAELGFIGRVMHGNNPKKWLAELRTRIGEPVDPTTTPPPSARRR